MKNLNVLISEQGIKLLKALIDKQLISLKHEKLGGSNIAYEKVEIDTSNGRYLIDNRVDWSDDYFSGPEDIPFLDFKRLSGSDKPFMNWPEDSTEMQIINEKIENILIVQDDCDIYRSNVYYQHMKSSEGIIIITDKAQYGFFKDNVYLDECVVVVKDEKNVLSKAESLKEHYDIFGYPFSGRCTRSLTSLKDGGTKEIDTAEEVGEITREK